MSCSCGSGGCGTSVAGDSKISGCQSNGGCKSGGCNRLNVFDWLSDISLSAERDHFNIVEVSFKNGSRKNFFKNPQNVNCVIGDYVTVESSTGFDIGTVSLCGELVRLQMRKKKVKEDSEDVLSILRIATESDLEKRDEAVAKEQETMIRARVIARNLGLEMKIGSVEYQANGRKATFFYTADSRVDFRELIKEMAGTFRVKIEMKQIGSRQEAGKIGGIGTCGRELCCSTWLTNFKSVSTSAARYQQLAINQAKLSGQCGRLKCCLNFELDTYIDALSDFPKNADFLKGEKQQAKLIKKDIFKKKLFYILTESKKHIVLDLDRVKEIQKLNKEGKFPREFSPDYVAKPKVNKEEDEVKYTELVGQTSLSSLERTSKRNKRKRSSGKKKRPSNRVKGQGSGGSKSTGGNKPSQGGKDSKAGGNQSNNPSAKSGAPKKKRPSRNRNRNKGRGPKPTNDNTDKS